MQFIVIAYCFILEKDKYPILHKEKTKVFPELFKCQFLCKSYDKNSSFFYQLWWWLFDMSTLFIHTVLHPITMSSTFNLIQVQKDLRFPSVFLVPSLFRNTPILYLEINRFHKETPKRLLYSYVTRHHLVDPDSYLNS